ncbi:MAG: SBBP repeat-containing protein [candidate division WOR-3 bacterium]
MAYAIAVDASGNVYVTGGSRGSGTRLDYATIKYNSAGDTVWVRRYNGPADTIDVAYAIAVDADSNVYVTGKSYGSGTHHYDYATIKYNSAGDTVWVRRYNGPGNYDDEAYAIAVDASGNVYVAGKSYGSYTSFDYATIKYNSAGEIVWVIRYNGPGNSSDHAYAIAVDGAYVYVTGTSWGGPSTDNDYATIKYLATQVEETNTKYQPAKLEVVPDLCSGKFVVKYYLPWKGKINLALYDLSGRLLKTIYSGIKEGGKYEIPVSPLRATGIYFIRLSVSDGKQNILTKTGKIIFNKK